MNPELLKLSSYNYSLPKELIAQYPLSKRSESKLMHVKRGTGAVNHLQFSDIVDLLNPGDVLVMNTSKVFPARLFALKENGIQIEVMLLHELSPCIWQCMVSPGRKLKTPQWVRFSVNLRGFVGAGDKDGLREVRFECNTPFWDEIERIGHVPLPPYIERNDEVSDRERYQTVYAKEIGSVAAPTAGLHFDGELLSELKFKGIDLVNVNLHVGIGTFRPVKTETISEHVMHAELATIPIETANVINLAKKQGRRIVCVGTTSARSIESFWHDGSLHHGSKWTDIFIYPGYSFKVMDAIITNFHLPQSSLLMMISAFGGYSMILSAYEQAIEHQYRFFSYGDAMFIED